MSSGSDERDEDMNSVAAAFRSNAEMYRDMGTPLYGHLFLRAAEDAELVELASHGQEGARPVHLLSAVHDLLLRDPDDPLARFFPTLTQDPAPAEEAFPELRRFCRERRSEILAILQSRTVQSTYVERCWTLMPAIAHVAELAGEPLNLIEIGCSAGVLLTFDRYAYDVPEHGIIGRQDAPLVLSGSLSGPGPLRIPEIGARIGIDLQPIDACSPDDRRWLLALCLPEFRAQQARLDTALDIVTQTGISLLEGDALDLLPGTMGSVAGPVCVFHSVCLLYWSAEAKVALDQLLCEASLSRDIYRLGLELAEDFDAYHAGRDEAPGPTERPEGATFDVTLTAYRCGHGESRVIAHATPDFTSLYWLG